MFDVLIVDDEKLIVSLIENLVQWEDFDMQVVGTADNGYSALEQVDKLRPDIVIVDVRMPGCDGLAFMKKVREINSSIRFIVISGHKKFEYAKSAMQYNVEDYLIKPINKGELEHILGKLKSKLDQQKQTELIEEKRVKDLLAGKIQLKKHFIEIFVEKAEDMEQIGREEANRTYLTNFQEGIFQIVILKIDCYKIRPDSGFVERLLYQIKEHIIEYLQPACYEVLAVSGTDCVYVICNYDMAVQKEVGNCLEKYRDDATERLKIFEEITLTICKGEAVDSFRLLGKSMKGAKRGIEARTALGVQRTIAAEEIKEDEGVILTVVSDDVREKWKKVIRGFQMNEIKAQIFVIFSAAERYMKKDNLIFYKTLLALHEEFYGYIKKIDLYKFSYETLLRELEENLRWDYTGRMMAADLEKQIEKYIDEYAGNENPDMNPAVKIAKKYIAENYQNNISMAGMAEMVNLNPVYFSMLFKREAGINFLDYLNKYRLEISKQYLKQIQYNINEVTEASGFRDSKYFSRLFKKTFGITPTEYRKRNVAEGEDRCRN